ncbi:serine hydrolase [Saliniramus sp.]|uniref:serine hydrolase n=1 Tax=Saliniramus sp. TaxID=2986772 RepID=UPI002C99E30B|nr:serine hydrolase [Saliniramus sp.]HMB11747.1 serine hydrolase [Saliniramus sp.]
MVLRNFPLRCIASRFAAALVATAMVLAACLVAATPVHAYNPPYAAVVIDVKTGRTLHAENADATRFPASLTKVMTLYLVFEQLERGALRLDSPLRVSSRAAAEPPSKLGLRAGSTITVENAILALTTRSANDVATAIAENLGGSVDAFTREMTRTARALGMKRTTFRNAHGLPNREQVTSARDMAILAIAVQDRFPQYYHYFSRRNFTFNGTTHRNHNRLIGRVTGVDGIKTGFIRASGFNLMTNAKTNSRHIVTVVMGGRSGAHRDGIVERLVKNNLPRAYAGARQTPVMNVAGAVAFVPNVLPPARPADIGVPPAAFASASATGGPLDLAAMRPAVAPERNAGNTVTPASSGTLRQGAAALAARNQNDGQVLSFADSTGSIPLPPADLGSRHAVDQNAPSDAASSAPVQLASASAAAPLPLAATPAEPEPEPVAVSPWVVQIAAVDSKRAALEMLENARNRVGGPLSAAAPFTEPVQTGGTTLHRARFSGFDTQGAARDACRQLERRGFACFASRS